MGDQRERRTQADRRAATRAALLDATIECLVEVGYGRLTTRLVADRAGVSQGAQQHHFATKDELVAAAVRELIERIASETLAAEEASSGGEERERVERLLNRLWQLHRGPLFAAAMEVLLAARTETALGEIWGNMSAQSVRHITGGAERLLPTTSRMPEFSRLLFHALAVMRGLAVQAWVPGLDPDRAWELVRPQLLDLFDAHVRAESAS